MSDAIAVVTAASSVDLPVSLMAAFPVKRPSDPLQFQLVTIAT